MRLAAGKNAKLSEPILSEHISGEKRRAAARRSETFIVAAPPVVILMMASVARRITGRKRAKTSGSPVGRPSSGTRACRWRIAAARLAAAIDCEAISSGVTGSASDMVGVCAEPVTAQLMMTLLLMQISIAFNRVASLQASPHGEARQVGHWGFRYPSTAPAPRSGFVASFQPRSVCDRIAGS